MGSKAVVTPFPAHHLQLPLAMAHVPAVLATSVDKAGALRCDFVDKSTANAPKYCRFSAQLPLDSQYQNHALIEAAAQKV